jgi:hypothetical protein
VFVFFVILVFLFSCFRFLALVCVLQVRRRKPVPEKYRASMPILEQPSSSSSSTSISEGGVCPFTGQPSSASAKCPFGFSSAR